MQQGYMYIALIIELGAKIVWTGRTLSGQLSRLGAKESSDDATSRRRKRRQQTGDVKVENVEINDNSLEDKFGLGNEQLRELLEQELPVPRENLATRKTMKAEEVDKEKAFQLPELNEFMKDTTEETDSQIMKNEDNTPKIDRSNSEEYLRVIQLNPFADADESMFLQEYDIIPSIFGSGKLLNIPVPYLQTGHGILLVISLLAALVYAPGNPLTEFPPEIREFLKQGLLIVYSINVVLAGIGFQTAKSKNLPAKFWAAKCFLLGGVAYYEISQAKDPNQLNKKVDPSDRKSRARKE
eukprot:gene4812-9598_t